MKKTPVTTTANSATKKGYNEKNPGEPQGAFPPASKDHDPVKEDIKSNTADKKRKEDQQ